MRPVYLLIACSLVLLLSFPSPACADTFTDEEGVEWLGVDNYTIYWGQEVNASGYLIKAADFSPSKAFDTDSDYVMLTVMSNRSETWQTVLARNNSNIPDCYIFGDRLNVTALSIVTGNNIPVPYTNISVYLANVTEARGQVIDKVDAAISVEESRAKEVYADERGHFEINVRNLRAVPTPIQVVQVIPDGLVFDPDMDMEWNSTLAAGGQKSYQYSLKALRPGTYNFTGTRILVSMDGRVYSKVLNSTQFIVHGPYINLTKTHSAEDIQVDDVVRVQVRAVNEGDRAAYVTVTDELPQGAALLDGTTSSSRILHPAENITLAYSMRIKKAGNITMPSAKASFTDPRDYEDIVYSRRYMLYVPEHGERAVQTGYYSESSREDTANASESREQPEAAEKDHGIFQIFYNLMGAISKFISGLR